MSTIIKAILKINPNAEVSVSGDDINSIVWENGTPPIAKEDIIAEATRLENVATQEAADKEARKASAKAKLEALGLTTEEIKEAFGI
jgi:hypothetical protein